MSPRRYVNRTRPAYRGQPVHVRGLTPSPDAAAAAS
jgi:hypothetical protein